jgi:hypothetical protein
MDQPEQRKSGYLREVAYLLHWCYGSLGGLQLTGSFLLQLKGPATHGRKLDTSRQDPRGTLNHAILSNMGWNSPALPQGTAAWQ